MTTSQKDLLHLQNSVENPIKESSSENEQLLERHHVKDTPFVVVGNKEEGYMLTLGRFQVSRRYPDKETCIDLVQMRDWELIMSVCSVVVDGVNAIRISESENK